MLRIIGSLLLALVVVACAEPGVSGTTSAAAPPVSAREGVEVIVTATPVEQPDGAIELCPPGVDGPCPGILLEGEIDPSLTSREQPNVVVVQGVYDGRRLLATEEPSVADFPLLDDPDFSSLCPDLAGDQAASPPEPLTTALSEYTAGQDDFAGMWWDQETSVMTVWFVGDDASHHQEAIAELAGDQPVCVAGGARFSEDELIEATRVIQSMTDSTGRPLVTPGHGVDTIRNRIPLVVEELDGATRRALTDAVGDRVVIHAFIEMAAGSLADLPDAVPAVPGDVEILTSPSRFGGGMDALGTFDLSYDADMNCLYFTGVEDQGGTRLVPVWPFGYSATSDPLTIFDYDGNVLAVEGDTLELGGGGVSASGLEGNLCGASQTWVVNR